MRHRAVQRTFVGVLGAVALLAFVCGCEPEPKKTPSQPAEKPAAPAEKPAAQAEKPAAEKAPLSEPAKPEVKPEEKKPDAKPEEKKPDAKPDEKKAEAKPANVKAEAFVVKAPLGLPPVPVPADNPMTAEKVELGKLLYFDTRVSKDETVSCATCHDPTKAWAEHSATSEGIHKQRGGRNSPTVINAAYADSQFWDGRADTLEAQAVGPVGNPVEMGHDMAGVVARFAKIPAYVERFQKVFGTGVTEKGFAQAVAAFERTVLSGDSPYDRYVAGDKRALDDAQQRGLELFEKHCVSCHKPPLFSNYRFVNAGVGMNQPKPDEGRKDVTKKASDLGKFRVPALREVANTAPYFHDGGTATLEDAVALMAAGGKDNANLSNMLKSIREAKLTPDNQKDMVAFLKGLSGKYPIIAPPKQP
jgi:cytochrome c peroxidase